jgi:hypothetical protein
MPYTSKEHDIDMMRKEESSLEIGAKSIKEEQ